jgi:hypothetical protein
VLFFVVFVIVYVYSKIEEMKMKSRRMKKIRKKALRGNKID